MPVSPSKLNAAATPFVATPPRAGRAEASRASRGKKVKDAWAKDKMDCAAGGSAAHVQSAAPVAQGWEEAESV